MELKSKVSRIWIQLNVSDSLMWKPSKDGNFLSGEIYEILQLQHGNEDVSDCDQDFCGTKVYLRRFKVLCG